MPHVIELRVHGVGGTPAHNLLGETGATEITRVAGAGKDGHFARVKEPRVEGYAWGPLTSGSPVQILWILLFPFTFFNVSGWTLPPPSEARRKAAWQFARLLLAFLGLMLTLTYAIGIFSLVVNRIFYDHLEEQIRDDDLRLFLGFGLVLFLMIGVFFISRNRQQHFEQRLGPDRVVQKSEAGFFHTLFHEGDGLRDRAFWARGKAAGDLLLTHSIFGLLLLLALQWYALEVTIPKPDTNAEPISMEPWFRWVGLGEAALLLLLVATCSLGFTRPVANFVKGGFRCFGPVVGPVIAIALTVGLFSGLAMLIERLFEGDWSIRGAEINLNLAFGLAGLAFALSLVALFSWLLLRAFRLLSDSPPVNTALPGQEANGATSRFMVALARSFSDFGRNGDWVLSVTALIFAAVASATLLVLTFRVPEDAPAGIAPVVKAVTGEVRPGASRGEVVKVASNREVFDLKLSFLAEIGTAAAGGISIVGFALTVAVVALLNLIRGGHRKPQTRRKVGILWDVLSFWPRRFHPLAVRPYAERAVPELQGRIIFHVEKMKRRVLLSAHSQGAILGFAALSQIVSADEVAAGEQHGRKAIADQVAFITYGAPLNQLHGRFFPGYFSSRHFDDIKDRLFQGNVELAGVSRPLCWRNFFRRTDYIGKKVLLGSPDSQSMEPQTTDLYNEVVPDPSEAPTTTSLSVENAWDSYPDPMRTPWITLALHSYYNDEEVLKTWVEKANAELAK